MTGSLTIHLAGTTYYDNVMSVFVLAGLALIITQREQLANGPLLRGALIAGLAGFSIGSAVGLKLPEAPFALGFAATLLILPGDASHRATRLLAGGLGGVAGFALFAGYWMQQDGAPDRQSALSLFQPVFQFTARAARLLSRHALSSEEPGEPALFPLLFSIDWGWPTICRFRTSASGSLMSSSSRHSSFCRFVGGRRSRSLPSDRGGALAFSAVSYVAWLKVFAIYRYILLLEILAPILIAASIAFGRFAAVALRCLWQFSCSSPSAP